MSCNVCRCGYNSSLLCTKMACISWPKTGRKGGVQKQKRPNVRVGPKLQPLPEGPCTPGVLYKKNCNRCFCTDDGVGVCSIKKNACGPGKNLRFTTPDDVRPPIGDEEFAQLPTLEHSAAKCEPGKAYKVECNTCICMTSGNMVCDKLLCFSQDDMHRIAASKLSGKSCNGSETFEDNCVRCTCNGTLQCVPIDGCVTEEERKTLFHGKPSKSPRVTLNFKKEKCRVNAVYRDDCNKCYCQPDRTLRCTQKTCLNHAQVLKLEKQRLYLEEHGL